MKTLKISFLAFATIMVVSCEKKTATTTAEMGAETADASTTQTVKPEDNIKTANATTSTANNEDAPIFTMESDVYDFGDVQAGSKTDKIVEFTNTGNAPLVITAAKASCGCTVPEFDKEPIAPGAKGTLKVSYKAPATNGKQTKTVTLTTNTATGTDRFKITANVVGGNEKQAPKPPVQAPKRELPAPNLGQ